MPEDVPSKDQRIPIKEDNPSVQIHLQILQSIVSRMGTNSSSAKAWCITLVSAILVVVADKGKPVYLCIALLPIILFLYLDAYYLALEDGYRSTYNDFVKRLHERIIYPSDLFCVKAAGNIGRQTLVKMRSLSVWPFYVTLLGTVVLAMWLVKAPVADSVSLHSPASSAVVGNCTVTASSTGSPVPSLPTHSTSMSPTRGSSPASFTSPVSSAIFGTTTATASSTVVKSPPASSPMQTMSGASPTPGPPPAPTTIPAVP